MIDNSAAPYAALLLRLCLGALYELSGAVCLILGIYPRYVTLFLLGDGKAVLLASPALPF